VRRVNNLFSSSYWWDDCGGNAVTTPNEGANVMAAQAKHAQIRAGQKQALNSKKYAYRKLYTP